MSTSINVINPSKPKRIAMIAANPAVSSTTNLPIGFWWAELTHPYREFVENGYIVDIYSPNGGQLVGDSYSDPEDDSQYSADDLYSLGFKKSPTHAKLIENTMPISEINIQHYDAVFLAGGQSPMYTFYNNDDLHQVVADFYEAGKVVGIICHATSTLLKIRTSDGKLLVDGKTWTGFANSEEDFADSFVGFKIQPFRIQDEALKIEGSNFITDGMFKSFAIRTDRLITGQQQYSGAAAAKLVIEALGV
jgi:putative intracellular protease/amidase